jgi:hypothetical protein
MKYSEYVRYLRMYVRDVVVGRLDESISPIKDDKFVLRLKREHCRDECLKEMMNK